MPRSGGGVFSAPAGTAAVTQTVIESAKYNALVTDLVTDANTPRPVVAGGTGATSAAAARTALGLAIGTNVQAYSATLAGIAGTTFLLNRIPFTADGTNWSQLNVSTYIQGLLNDATAAEARTTLGAIIGTDVQAFGATLTALEALSLVAGDTFYATGADAPARLAKGAAGQVLRQNDGLTAPEWGSPGVLGAAQSLSGAGPFSQAVPTWATRAEVMLFGASMSGATDSPIVQLSTGGVFVTAGYTSYCSLSANAITATNGLVIGSLAAANSITAIMTLRKITGNTWIETLSGSAFTGNDDGLTGSGSIALDGAIDGIRVARSGTTDTFDAGNCAVYWS